MTLGYIFKYFTMGGKKEDVYLLDCDRKCCKTSPSHVVQPTQMEYHRMKSGLLISSPNDVYCVYSVSLYGLK